MRGRSRTGLLPAQGRVWHTRETGRRDGGDKFPPPKGPAQRRREEGMALESGGQRTSVLITGAGGYLGSLCLERLAASPGAFRTIVALDVREVPPGERRLGVD